MVILLLPAAPRACIPQTTLRSLDSVTSMTPAARLAMVNAMTTTETYNFSNAVKAYVNVTQSHHFTIPLPAVRSFFSLFFRPGAILPIFGPGTGYGSLHPA